jgi:type IX secretion system PorP/SprF family membrane protein
MRHLFLVVIAIGSSLAANSQDPLTSQPMSTFTEINPSFMGKDSSNTAYFNYRNQWPSIQGTYLTSRFGYHHYLSRTNGYIGISLMRDDAGSGTLTTTNLALNYAQNIKIKKVLIKAGVKAGYYQKVLDWSKLTFGDQIDQELGFISSTSQTRRGQQGITHLDFSAGTSIYWKGFTVGGAVFHLTGSNSSFGDGQSDLLPELFTFQLAKTMTIQVSKYELDVSPYINYRNQRDFQSTEIGLLTSYRWIVLGFSYRHADAINTIGGINTKYVCVIYSYDHTLSALAGSTGGAHEISLIFHPFKKRKKAHKNLMSVKSPFML